MRNGPDQPSNTNLLSSVTEPIVSAVEAPPAEADVSAGSSGRRNSYATAALVCAAAALIVWLFVRWRVAPLQFAPPTPPAATVSTEARATVFFPEATFLSPVATFRDELFGYLMFRHYEGLPQYRDRELLLIWNKGDGEPEYRVVANMTPDYAATVRDVTRFHAAGLLEQRDWRLASVGVLDAYRKQTRLFVSAYNLPANRKMEQMSRAELHALLQRFIRFKSSTDPRVRRRLEPVPRVLSAEDAHRLAGDMITVAEFYDLPLEYLLGIGAMENNYMNVRGDLEHSIWKRRPAKDDIVLERRRGRVRVLNDSAGVWQITRQTLRYAHQLYLRDKRDYSRLPEHLLPPKQLWVDDFDHTVLTTYAGLLLRDLLDRFEGDVSLAVGAYNGGPGNPNLRYHQGVEAVAKHARSILERAAALNGRSVMETSWLTSP